ncbi:hypothetical protein [Streptomyces sp. bgisy032]|uniref:hypothetical protein n=1 Tax=Streptomyces sp. bgisy032 TaxID=3413773 RepID=UPI003D756C16
MTTPGFRPTHVVPRHGMPAWEAPDPSRPTVDLDPLLPVQLLERQGDWGHVLCFNGWSAWVDGRLLVAVAQDPPATDGPLTRTADPRPLLARAEESLARYRSALEDLAGGLDGESFHQRTRGLRIGVVVDGESMWLYDTAHGHWVYAAGTQLTTYATDDTPRAEPESRPSGPPEHPRTRVVAAEGPDPEPGPPLSARAAPPEPAGAMPPEAPERARVMPPEAPEPTGVVSPEAPEATRVVPPEAPERAEFTPPKAPEPREPTRVVSPAPAEPAAPAAPPESSESSESPEPTRVVAREDLEPSEPQVPEGPPTRVVSNEREGR